MFSIFGFNFLERVISNGSTKIPSAKRWGLVAGMLFMGSGLLIISCRFAIGTAVDAAVFWAFTLPISLMAGVSYSSVEIAKAKALPQKEPGDITKDSE